ncbi:MAG: sigma-70 family RNA polymerase sigma factor [Acidobacteria bacterium]|nr:sigma-70 family RNA polymerase sigma factor [Acidobacteriota bacterium]
MKSVRDRDSLLTDPEHWVDNHGDYLYRFALLRIHNTHLAEDMVQETFLAALKSTASFEGRSSERTWLTGILKRKIVDHYRKNARITNFPEFYTVEEAADFQSEGKEKGHWKPGAAPSDWGKNPQRFLENKDFNDVLLRCLEYLPRSLAVVFTVREMEGWRSEEICKEFSISTSNLWVMLHRARAQLRKCLDLNWFNALPGKE